MEVKAVLGRLNHLGLEVRRETGSGHWKVHDPKTGAWLFNVSSSPSDANWHYNIARHLRRIGLSLQSTSTKRKKPGKTHSAVDLVALARAQDAARAAGERVPQLEDLDEAPPTSPLWNRKSENGQREALKNMAARAEAARVNLVRSRLVNFMAAKNDELSRKALYRNKNVSKGKGAKAEFVRIAMEEVGPTRNMRVWKSVDSGQQSLSTFLMDAEKPTNEQRGLTFWTLNLIEATMDHIEGLRWGIDESRITKIDESRITKPEEAFALDGMTVGNAEVVSVGDPLPKAPEKPVEPSPEPEVAKPAPKPKPILRELPEPTLRERYANVLLKRLENMSMNDASEKLVDTILERLDKLVGLDTSD